MEIAQLSAIILGFAGSLILAFSVIENPGGGYQDTEKWGKVQLASILMHRFRWGVGLLVSGFFLQLVVLVEGFLK